MKNKTNIFFTFIILICLSACGGYNPIFGLTNLEFKITEKKIEGDKQIAKLIYNKLQNVSQANQNNESAKNIVVSLNVNKKKKSTVKDKTGKIKQYKIILDTDVIIKDATSNQEILRRNFSYSSSFEVQKQYSETKKLEDKITQNLINKTYQELLIKISEII